MSVVVLSCRPTEVMTVINVTDVRQNFTEELGDSEASVISHGDTETRPAGALTYTIAIDSFL